MVSFKSFFRKVQVHEYADDEVKCENIRFSHDDEICRDTNILMMRRGARAKNPDVEEKLVEVNIKILKY